MNRFLLKIGVVFFSVILMPAVALAETPEGIDAGDTGFMLICTAMVLLMTPALGFYYGGIGRSKNMLNVLMMSFILLGITSVQWVLFGYSTAFAPTVNGFFGGSDFWLFQGVGLAPYTDYAPTIPAELYSMFQMVFVMITPAIIGGAVAGAYVYFAKLTALGFGTTVIPGIAICDPAHNGYLNYIIAHLIGFGVGLAATIILKPFFKEEK